MNGGAAMRASGDEGGVLNDWDGNAVERDQSRH